MKVDLTSRVFGRLTVSKPVPKINPQRHQYWICNCICGAVLPVDGTKLANGHTQSCGCFKREQVIKTHTTHGESKKTIEYQTWCSIKARCCNPNSKSYVWYGERGITICDEWIDSFQNFLADMGRRPKGCTIERKDVNGSYSPSNCIWASNKEQGRNRRNNVIVVFNGTSMTMIEASKRSGIRFATLGRRVRAGWPPDRLFNPVQPWGR